MQRIQHHEAPHEVLILTSIQKSVDEVLDNLDTPNEENDLESDIDVSDTSSSTEDHEEDGDGREHEQQQHRFRLEAFLVSWDDPIHEKCLEGRRLPDYVAHVYPARKLRRDDIGWIETGDAVVIKAVSWECIRAWRDFTSEDIVKEVKTLNYLSDELHGRLFEDTHVLTANTVMYNDSHLYVVMPNGGRDLCMFVQGLTRTRLTEDESRFYFRQILKYDMSPEVWEGHPLDGHAVDIWAGKFTLF
ncbi:hypothetical protein ACHAW5_006907 [Stephanodiscus triporus]|uniref:Uncharacterized protein n=1 Tax=Stephanodiscus triporus TaxID=2934178 RepID=A0ABD3NKP3_9STRA